MIKEADYARQHRPSVLTAEELNRIDALAVAMGFEWNGEIYVRRTATRKPYTRRAAKQPRVLLGARRYARLPKVFYQSIYALGVGEQANVTAQARAYTNAQLQKRIDGAVFNRVSKLGFARTRYQVRNGIGGGRIVVRIA